MRFLPSKGRAPVPRFADRTQPRAAGRHPARRRRAARAAAAVLAAVLVAAGCGSGSSLDDGPTDRAVAVAPAELLAGINAVLGRALPRALASWDWARFLADFGPLLAQQRYGLSMRKVAYTSVGADGQPAALSGLLILPASSAGRTTVPILLYQHGTEPYRRYSPSRYLDNRLRPTDYPEVMIAAAIASSGYAVAMADYEGLGDSPAPQPYAHAASLARQVVDMLRASREVIAAEASPSRWNGQLFLLGYSEGGFVTMAATRELQVRHAGEFAVTAAAPLSGPHDLSGTMRQVMLSDAPFKAPYFLPFVLTGYDHAYGSRSDVFSASFSLVTPFSGTLPPLFDGNSPSDAISEAMGMSFDPARLVVPRSVLAPPFLEQLAADTSPVAGFLRENDSYRGWVPAVPVRMFHHRDDELVPVGNSRAALAAFRAADPGAPVSLVEETFFVPTSDDPAISVHLAAAFRILAQGWLWLDGFRR